MRRKTTLETTSTFDKDSFQKWGSSKQIFVDFNIRDQFKLKNNVTRFKFSNALQSFANANKNLFIYLTNSDEVKNFKLYGNDWLLNIEDFVKFCEDIGSSKKDERRVAAFFGQHISPASMNLSATEKLEFLNSNVSEDDLITHIRNLPNESRKGLIEALMSISSSGQASSEEPSVNTGEFIEVLSALLKDQNFQQALLNAVPQVQINVLEELKTFVHSNLTQNETFFQNWLDEDNGKYRKKRSLIFGIEYVDPLREGEIMGRKRFDILATQNRESHILIELKSPTAAIFEIDERGNLNGGRTTSYKMSPELSRAIPQVLGYKRWYGEMNAETIQGLGLNEKKHVSECIVVIGERVDDDVWKANFKDLQANLSVRIWTYTDLIDRMENTIRNLKENLK
jgi:hypothetical protein